MKTDYYKTVRCCMLMNIFVWIPILGSIAFGFYIWYINIFYETDGDDGNCFVTGYDYELKTERILGEDVYYCRPYLLVRYTFAGDKYTGIKTYTEEYKNMDQALHYSNFTEIEQGDCIKKLAEMNQYLIGKNINNCHATHKYPTPPNCLCRYWDRIINDQEAKFIDNSCCGYGYVKAKAWFIVVACYGCFLLPLMGVFCRYVKSNDDTSTCCDNCIFPCDPETDEENQVTGTTAHQTTIPITTHDIELPQIQILTDIELHQILNDNELPLPKIQNDNEFVPIGTIYVSDMCVTCKQEKPTNILFPCCHYCLCDNCLETYIADKIMNCPCCRGKFSSIFKMKNV